MSLDDPLLTPLGVGLPRALTTQPLPADPAATWGAAGQRVTSGRSGEDTPGFRPVLEWG